MPDFLALARLLALQSTYKIRVGAVIVRNGKPIGVGFNRIYSHPKWVAKKCDTLHAEMAALMTCANNCRNATIYVYRIHKDGTPALARPCNNCLSMLVEYSIKKVVYTVGEMPYFQVERI